MEDDLSFHEESQAGANDKVNLPTSFPLFLPYLPWKHGFKHWHLLQIIDTILSTYILNFMTSGKPQKCTYTPKTSKSNGDIICEILC